MSLGDKICNLIECANDEVDELHLADRPQADVAHPAGRADDGALADRRVNHALPAKPFQQSFACFERAAVHADIFAHQQNGGISLHLLKHGLPDGFQKGDLRSARCGSDCRGSVPTSHVYLLVFREALADMAFAFFGVPFVAVLAGRPFSDGFSMAAGASPK